MSILKGGVCLGGGILIATVLIYKHTEVSDLGNNHTFSKIPYPTE